MQTLQEAPERIQQLMLWRSWDTSSSGSPRSSPSRRRRSWRARSSSALSRWASASCCCDGRHRPSGCYASGGLLALGGLSQLLDLALQFGGVDIPILYSLSTAAIFAGVGGYVYVVWVRR